MYEKIIINALQTSFEKTYPSIRSDMLSWESLTKPPSREMGDIAFVCFELAKILKQPPNQIADSLVENLPPIEILSRVETKGPYINFFFNRGLVIKRACEEIIKEGPRYGCNASRQGQRIGVEFSSPNTNKPLHLGHLRNTLLGDALTYILQANGAKVFRINLINDRGIHICKTILAYQKWAADATPESFGIKGDHYVGNLYVQFEKAYKQEISKMGFIQKEFESWASRLGINLSGLAEREIETRRDDYNRNRSSLYQEAQALLRLWEENNQEVRRLWQMMNEWVMDGFKKTYSQLGVSFDRYYLESETYLTGKSLIENGLVDDIFEKDSTGAVIADLRSQGFGKKVLLRPDGTSLYITQDLGTTIIKQCDYNLTHSICVVAREQEYHFKVLASLFDLLGYKQANNLYHLSYGMVHLPEGRMKSREGTVVDIDDFLQGLYLFALEEIETRANIVGEDSQKSLARMISLAAAKFGFLNVDPNRDMTFNPKDSISFSGCTGPYIQYANARAKSILAKAKDPIDVSSTMTLNSDTEMKLASTLSDYPAMVEKASQEYNPSIVASYLYKLAQAFSSFYHTENILQAESEEWRKGRLVLCATTSQVLNNGLGLLGIEAPDTM